MPKKPVKIVPVNKAIFLLVLKHKHSSIRKLGQITMCSEKTIRRELNERGGLRQPYVEDIARRLDVDERLLTGELFHYPDLTDMDFIEKSYPITNIELYPYFRGEQAKKKIGFIDETLRNVLSIFEISFSQFQDKDFENQFLFQQDLFAAIASVIDKHFDKDGYGDVNKPMCFKILSDLDNYREEHYLVEHAEKKLRPHFMANPPTGFTREIIKKMSSDDIIALDIMLQNEDVGLTVDGLTPRKQCTEKDSPES